MVLPKEMAKSIPKTHLLSEDEWRSIGVQQSKGWVHYMIHEPGELLCIINFRQLAAVNIIFKGPRLLEILYYSKQE